MLNKNKSLKVIVGLFVVASAFGCAGNKKVANDDPDFVESIEVRPLQGPMTPEHAQRLSKLTRMAVDRISTARKDLGRKDYRETRTYLKRASQILFVVKSEMPAAAVIEDIVDVKDSIETDSFSVIHQNLIPIYEQLDEIALFMPKQAKNAKMHLNNAKKHAKRRNKNKTKKSLEFAGDELIYGEVGAKVDGLVSTVRTAQNLVKQKKYKAAKKLIDDSQFLIAISDTTFLEPEKKR